MVEYLENKKKMGEDFQEAYLSLANAQWAAGEFG